MSGKPTRMSLVKQLLRMHHNGIGIKTIARTLCVSKNTVKSYILKVKDSGIPFGNLLKLEDPLLEISVARWKPSL
ncbi:MAG: hypothetical protein COB98_07395 [Flavobacteriaceae bacterium]|nr:MAG: hypothetical protein COB98_07395 [Flavobacteriaceae bacterium]